MLGDTRGRLIEQLRKRQARPPVGGVGAVTRLLAQQNTAPQDRNPFSEPSRRNEFEDLTPEDRQKVIDKLKEGQSPDGALAPEGYDPRESRFDDAGAYRTAQASDAYPIKPAGVGDQSNINTAAYAYRTFNQALDDYDRLIEEGGVALLPGVQKDSIKVARRNLQMQMKELYNLGVLNGPDLDLMNEILIDPVGIGNKALDVLGIADTEERVDGNIKQVRRIMRQLVEPKLKAMGVSPEEVAPRKPVSEMTDEELLQALQGGG